MVTMSGCSLEEQTVLNEEQQAIGENNLTNELLDNNGKKASLNPADETEDILGIARIIVEDDIWYKRDRSRFYYFIGNEIRYQCCYNRENEEIEIVIHGASITATKELYRDPEYAWYSGYRLEKRSDKKDLYAKQPLSTWGSPNYDSLEEWLSTNIIYEGQFQVGEIRKPVYDIDSEDIEIATMNVLSTVEHSYDSDKLLDIYMQGFYKGSTSTLMVYRTDDDRWWMAPVSTIGIWSNKSVEITGDMEYIERLLEDAYKVK